MWPDVILSALIALWISQIQALPSRLSPPTIHIPQCCRKVIYSWRRETLHHYYKKEACHTGSHTHIPSSYVQKYSTQVTCRGHVRFQHRSFVLRQAALPSCPPTSDLKTGEQHSAAGPYDCHCHLYDLPFPNNYTGRCEVHNVLGGVERISDNDKIVDCPMPWPGFSWPPGHEMCLGHKI